MADLGDPSSYIALENGTPVYASGGEEVGRVHHVLADVDDDIFDGIVLDTSRLPGGHRFVDIPQIDKIYDRGVTLTISAEEAGSLPEPEKHAATMETGPDDTVPDDMGDKLRRAWQRISGQS